MTLPIPEPLDIPDPNIDEPALPGHEPVDDPAEAPSPGSTPSIGDPPPQAAPTQA